MTPTQVLTLFPELPTLPTGSAGMVIHSDQRLANFRTQMTVTCPAPARVKSSRSKGIVAALKKR